MKTCITTRSLIRSFCAAALLVPIAAQADSLFWDGSAGDGFWTNGPQDTMLVTFPNNPTTQGANWTINGGTPGQLAVPDATTPGTNLINYLYSGHDWTISGATINENVQVRLDGGSLNITNSTVSLIPTTANTPSALSGLNLGEAGNPTTAVFTNSTVNIGRSKESSGNSLRIMGGSSLSLVNSTINTQTELGLGVTGRVALDGANASLVMDANSLISTGGLMMSGAGASATINGGTLNIKSASDLTGAGVTFNATNATISTQTLNLTNAGSSYTVNGGSLTVTSAAAAVNISNSGANLSLTNVDVNIAGDVQITNSNATITMNGGTFDAKSIRLNSGAQDPLDKMFNFMAGAITLTDLNPLRDSTGFEGQFNWTGAIGSGTITHTDLSANDTNLVAKVAQGFFSIEGTRVAPTILYTTDWTQQANIDALNAELLTLSVNGKAFALVQDLNAGTQVLSLIASLDPADLDQDGDVDDADFGLAFAAFTGPGGGAAVPEPTGLALLGVGGMLLIRRRRA